MCSFQFQKILIRSASFKPWRMSGKSFADNYNVKAEKRLASVTKVIFQESLISNPQRRLKECIWSSSLLHSPKQTLTRIFGHFYIVLHLSRHVF